jgi:hypothetical protein
VRKPPVSTIDWLLRLDSSEKPGLTKSEFGQLFAECQCGLVVTQRRFHDHVCIVTIDLTSDTDVNDEVVMLPPTTVIDLTSDSD